MATKKAPAKKMPSKAAKVSTKKAPAKPKVQKPTTRELLNKATTLEQLEAIPISVWENDDDLEELLDIRISAILEAESAALKKRVKPFVEKFEKAKKTLRDFVAKSEKLTMTVNIPVTLTLDVTNLDADSLIQDAVAGWSYSLEDTEWDACATIGKLDLSKRQLELLNSVDALTNIEDTIDDSIRGACSQVFEFFAPSTGKNQTSIEEQLQAMYNALSDEKENVECEIDEFNELVSKASRISIMGRFREPTPQVDDFLET